MSAKEIKRLVGKFNDVEHEIDYAEMMLGRKELSLVEQGQWETEADLAEQELYTIASEINKLKPSKYMMEKYRLKDILSFL